MDPEFDFAQRGPAPVLLVVAETRTSQMLFDHLTKSYDFCEIPAIDDSDHLEHCAN